MRLYIAPAALLLAYTCQCPLLAEVSLFGPETFTRSTASPQAVTRTFSAPNLSGPFFLIVQNGEGQRGRVSSAIIQLNGRVIVAPDEFNNRIDVITKPLDQLLTENQLSIEIRSQPGSSIIVTVTGPGTGLSPIRGVTISPDAFLVNSPALVTIHALIPYSPSSPPPAVILERLDDTDNVISIDGTLVDNGDLTAGDEVQGDGVFTIRKTYTSAVPQRFRFRLEFMQGGLTNRSAVFFLDALTPISDSQFNNIKTLQQGAQAHFYSELSQRGRQAATKSTLDFILGNPNVLQVGASESGTGIWILYADGILGGLLLNNPGTLGDPIASSITPAANAKQRRSLIRSTFSSALALKSGDVSVGNQKVLLLSPFASSLSGLDVNPTLKTLFESTNCPKYDVTYLADTAVTVETFKTLSQYGIYNHYGHGDSYYNGIFSFWQDYFHWPFTSTGQVVILTSQVADTTNKVTYQADLKKGRLAIVTGGGDYYAILPTFISAYNGTFPESLIFINACRSLWNNTMANAFLSKGAKTYLGYSDNVNASFATERATDFFNKWLLDSNNLVTTGESFTPGLNDGQKNPAAWLMVGASNLEAPSGTELLNGDFETGNLGAWSGTGDGRVVTQLGTFTPSQGSYAGIISTGLGFTVASGSIGQKACIDPSVKTLTFDWNFSSEEFKEWCGSIYQDFFRVDIQTASGSTNLFFRKVDDLCGSVFKVPFSFDRGDVWSTGWQSSVIDMAAIASANAGKPVTLIFSAGDVGDSIYDTAILLDRIKLNK